MDRRRSSGGDSRLLRESNLYDSRALQRRHEEVNKEEEKQLRRTDREIETLRRELDDLLREKAMASSMVPDVPGSSDSEFGSDAYTTPVIHEARQRVKTIREKVARTELELRRATEASERQGACGGAPRLIVDEVMPQRARRSMSVPNVPAQLEKFSVDRMPGGAGTTGFGFGGLLGTTASLQVPGSGGPPLRKRSIDFSQLSSLGVIRESD